MSKTQRAVVWVVTNGAFALLLWYGFVEGVEGAKNLGRFAVACPSCFAGVDQMCKRPSEHKAQDFHRARKAIADKIHAKQGDPGILNITGGAKLWGRGIWRYERT